MPSNPLYATPAQSLKARLPRPALTDQELAFVDEFLSDTDPELAGQRAGLKPGEGGQYLSRKTVAAAIQIAIRARNERFTIQPDYALLCWMRVVRADPRELSEHWRVPCRHCWGIDHLYQYDDVELRALSTEHLAKQMKLKDKDRVPFDEQGGGGYTINKLPCRGRDFVDFVAASRRAQGLPPLPLSATAEHSCPRCSGWGRDHVIYHDTRHLSPDAAALYLSTETMAGGGFKIVMRDKGQAEQMLARHAGLFNERKPIQTLDPELMTNEQLISVIATVRARLGLPPRESGGLLGPVGGQLKLAE